MKGQITREVIVKLVNAAPHPREVDVRLEGVKRVRSGAKAFLLTSEKLCDVNTLDEPDKVAPRQVALGIKTSAFRQVVPAHAMMVLRIPVVK